MGVPGWKRIIAIVVLVAFMGIGLAWAVEQGVPQFQEKPGTPVVKKHHKFPWLIVLLGAAAVGVGIYFLTKKDSGDDATVNIGGKDVVTDTPVSITLTLKLANGKEVSGAGSFSLKGSNSITDIVVTSAPNYYLAYLVFTDADGNVLGYKDKNGMNHPVSVENGKQYFVRLISTAIDIVLLANCVGNQGNGDVGDGTIQNYNTADGNVSGVVQKRAAIMKGTEYPQDPTEETVNTFKRALEILNAIPHNRVQWTYVGIVTEKLTDGMTYITKKVSPGGASSVSSNTIIWSAFVAPADIEFGTVLEEAMNNGGGPMWDAAGYDGRDGGRSPYIGGNATNPVWLYNAEYAIALSNGPLPRGFKLKTDGLPTSHAQPLASNGGVRAENAADITARKQKVKENRQIEKLKLL